MEHLHVYHSWNRMFDKTSQLTSPQQLMQLWKVALRIGRLANQIEGLDKFHDNLWTFLSGMLVIE